MSAKMATHPLSSPAVEFGRKLFAVILSIPTGERTPLAGGLGSSPNLKPRTSSQANLLVDDDVNTLIGVTSMLLALCILAVGGRLLARRMSKVELEADDYLIMIALVRSSFLL